MVEGQQSCFSLRELFTENIDIPAWALRKATVEDLSLAREARRLGRLRLRWPDRKALRVWASQQGWPTPWLGFEEAFVVRMLEDEKSFELALQGSGVEALVPREDSTISAERVRELDARRGVARHARVE